MVADFVPHPLDARLPKNIQRAARPLLQAPDQRVFSDDDHAAYSHLHAVYEKRERLVRAVWVGSLPRKLKTLRDPTGDYQRLLNDNAAEAAAISASFKRPRPPGKRPVSDAPPLTSPEPPRKQRPPAPTLAQLRRSSARVAVLLAS